MSAIEKMIKMIADSDYRFECLATLGMLRWMNDEKYLKRLYRIKMGKELNLDYPETFNEKLQWLKLYDRRPEYTTMVDKYEVKKYVAEMIGERYIIPTLGVWNHFDDIDFDKLPNQFVLKCTHDSGGLVIVQDKSKFDKAVAKKKIENSLKRKFYYVGREWPYKNVKPRIIAEQYMVDESGYELKDYKIFTSDGFAKALYIATDRQSEEREMKRNFYDMEFKKISFWNSHPNADVEIKRSQAFEEMRLLAEKIAKGIPRVRVDFYDINGKVYFGEMTFYHNSSLTTIHPEEWDYKFGEWIKLPEIIGGGYLIANNGFILYIHDQVIKELRDYKLFCFNGEPQITLVCSNRFSDRLCEDFFDQNWTHLEVKRPGTPNADKQIKKPVNFEKMKVLARKLAKNIPHIRVDFYEINNQLYFGELTFYSGSGLVRFEPPIWDKKLGDLISI